MYRVLLVDDEALARVGLRSTFDWEAHGFRIVGEASNGRTALPWIERDEVDILMTDIAMPVMDGLELMRFIRQRRPRVKVILLSCHSDFEYVREGMRLGASDYLLKPTLGNDDLRDILEKVKRQIEEERRRNELFDRMKRQELAEHRQELEKAMIRCLAGEPVEAELAAALPWLKTGYRVAVVLPDGAAKLCAEEGGLYLEILIEDAQETFYEKGGDGLALRGREGQLIAVVPDGQDQPSAWNERLERLQRTLSAKGHSFSIGVSMRHQGLPTFRQAYREGWEAAQARFYRGPGRLHTYEPSPPRTDHDGSRLYDDLRQALADSLKDKASACLAEICGAWTPERRTPAQVYREAQQLLSLFSVSKKRTNGEFGVWLETLRQLETADEVRQFVRESFDCLWAPECDADGRDNRFYRHIVAQAVEYMQSRYTEKIGLQEVADHVCVSKNYFSEIFKRVTGQNFIDYLIRLRLDRAKELLQTTPLKIYEVAELSGFNDVKYFSRLFKKVMKMSPAEFREHKFKS
ncbi:response regulator containing CheY-like receiver domain and AraC-type DNA-binding domain [Thermobacillus composti KWC4]|uniref:Response regulator containing CheY-like receiver domain and AraC-type DNA-binding domain n=1 Tax=Thermobacillus composti (strain DSM 18247 / JCM 13945 / KWC4) TaxID=717605 RepID=L0EBM4_THECK|nr:response regulator [Thermobacillus composti]AGA57668.1 response regulator containing CheY-like receiver domain and AraC-type DNA-binding domain [Thermobacillus composti KWC4]